MSNQDIPGPGSYNANENYVRDSLNRGGNFSNSPERRTDRSISPNRDHSLNLSPG